MEDLGKDVIYFARILRSLCIEEQRIEGLCRDIQSSYKRSVVKVEKEDDKVEVEEEVPESLVREIENALSKARLALENSELRTEKSSKPPKRPVDASCVGKKVPKTSTVTEKDKSKPQKQVVNRVIASGSKNRNPTTTKHRPRSDRTSSDVDLLRKRAKSWLASSADTPQPSLVGTDNLIRSSTGSANAVVSFDSFPERIKSQEVTGQEHTDCWELNSNTIERINDVVALSKSVERFSKEALLSTKDTTAREDFLSYCNSLSPNTLPSRRYFAENLPKLVELMGQFFEVLDVIDWSVATPGQHQWRNQMLENFVALFNIAMHFKPILLGDENTAVKIANLPKQKDFAPSMETIWRAYVCSGQKVPSSYTDPPIEIPSRAFRLTLGPAVFSNHPEVHRDFQQMVGLWSDIFHLQRRLQCLDYIESRLPHWLRLIAEQPTEKASTLRLLCQIACDCYPVTIERE